MSANGAVIDTVRLTPTHDGEAALVIGLRFENGGRSNVQINADEVRAVMAKAGVGNAMDLVGRCWTVLDVKTPDFLGAAATDKRESVA